MQLYQAVWQILLICAISPLKLITKLNFVILKNILYIQFFFQSYNYPWKCTMCHIILNFFFFRHRSEAYSVRPCGRQELQRRWTPAGSRSGLRGLSTDSSDFCWLVRCNPDIQWGEWISSDLGVLFIFHSSCTKYDLAEIF